jgi:short-subunit dehydrogenase
MVPLGVQVVVIEPGPVITDMLGRASETPHDLTSAMTPEHRQRYGGLMHAVAAQAAASAKLGLSADAAAEVIAKALTARKPRTRYTVGRSTAVLTRLVRVLPDRTLDRLFAAALRPYFPKES